MKKVIVILMVALLAFGMFGCGNNGGNDTGGNDTDNGGTDVTPPPEVVKIGISLPTQREERWVLDKESFDRTAAAMGIEVNIQIADNDAGRQQTQCENLITQGVTALIVAPHDGEAAK
ncbi:MAG: substrate-binding domain-containing protein, partial [Clostridiales bacterium]|nr:substrate-binding domain-containing protein [Clostridiales bacterium]